MQTLSLRNKKSARLSAVDIAPAGPSSALAAVGFQAPSTADLAPDGESPETRRRITEEAYRIAEERGFPQDAAVDHWLEAERRVGVGHAESTTPAAKTARQ
ncbi:MAG: hypothetical protein JWR80_6399 [Bradyrhizobium sp.]|nr:hypothetical protein [Bradyrhizobium sp.]